MKSGITRVSPACLFRARIFVAGVAILVAHTDAAVFRPDAASYWPSGVVLYRYDSLLPRIGFCTPQGAPLDPSSVDCDTANGNADCGTGEVCVPNTGRCVPTQMPEWTACQTDVDCPAGGLCNELSGKCLGQPMPGFDDCDLENPTCPVGETCLPRAVANPCIAIKLWEQVANLAFVEVGCVGTAQCPGHFCVALVPDHYVNFQLTYGDPLSSSIGMNSAGSQSIGVNPSGNFGFGFVHEVGHALGVHHEMQRTDRNTYINTYPEINRVVAGKEGNFAVHEDASFYPLEAHGYAEPFDFDSIMMYPLCVYSDCSYQHDEDGNVITDEDTGEPVSRTDCDMNPPEPCCDPNVDDDCRPIDPNYTQAFLNSWSGHQEDIGQRSHFSKLDALVMSFLYPEINWKFVDRNYGGRTQIGSFLQPFRTIAGGVGSTPSGGTLWVQPGTYSAVGTYTQPMNVYAPIGPVYLGN